MINIKHIVKVSSAWISIVYVICFAGVALFPGIRSAFMMYSLHTQVDLGSNVMTVGTFISGLVIWNIIAIINVWLFAILHNKIKE